MAIPSQAEPRLQLLVDPGEGPVRRVPLQAGTHLIGRGDDADVVLPDREVGRKHARLWVRDDGVYIEDLASANGTFVNGSRVSGRALRAGDVLQLGKFTITVDEDVLAPIEDTDEVTDATEVVHRAEARGVEVAWLPPPAVRADAPRGAALAEAFEQDADELLDVDSAMRPIPQRPAPTSRGVVWTVAGVSVWLVAVAVSIASAALWGAGAIGGERGPLDAVGVVALAWLVALVADALRLGAARLGHSGWRAVRWTGAFFLLALGGIHVGFPAPGPETALALGIVAFALSGPLVDVLLALAASGVHDTPALRVARLGRAAMAWALSFVVVAHAVHALVWRGSLVNLRGLF